MDGVGRERPTAGNPKPILPAENCLADTAPGRVYTQRLSRWVLRLPVLANVRHWDKLLSGLVETSPSLSPHFTPSPSVHGHQSPRSTLYSKLHLSVCPENPTCHTCPHPADLGVNWEDPPHPSFLEGVTRFVQNYKSLAFLGYFLDICWVILGYFSFGYFLGNSWVFLWLTLGYFSSLWLPLVSAGQLGPQGLWGSSQHWLCRRFYFLHSYSHHTHWETSLVSYFLSCALRASCVHTENPSIALSFSFHAAVFFTGWNPLD